MKKDLGNYRKVYEKSALMEDAISEQPMQLFQKWFQEVETSGQLEEPNTMTIATIGLDGFPKNRVVLLKEFGQEGFIFYTNYLSEKGKAIARNPQVCLSFFWPHMERQVIVKGRAEKVSEKVSDAYFESRPDGSKLGAIASEQSAVIVSREVLENALKKLEEEFQNNEIKRPTYWGGYLVQPISIEFWQGRPNRLHDRIKYTLEENDSWKIERLAP